MSSLIVEICKINEVKKHPNADKLDIIKVKGWQCIVSKALYKVGDLVIYCPPDSIIPPNLIEKYKLEFLKKNGRVGSIKLRGELSQGLILNIPNNCYSWKEGLNVATMLGITKYEQPEPEYSLKGRQVSRKKSNPFFDKYTDIENINNFENVFEEGEPVVITEKIHGCNARYGNLPKSTSNIFQWVSAKLFGSHEFVYGSRNVQKKLINLHRSYYKKDVWGEIARRYKFNEWLPKDYIIYGEIYGEGIQDLTYGMKKDIHFLIFDIKYKGKYLSYVEFIGAMRYFNVLCYSKTGRLLNRVPEIAKGEYDNNLLKCCTGNSMIAPDQIREGCVIKPYIEREHYKLGRVVLKVINPDYLTRKGGTEFK